MHDINEHGYLKIFEQISNEIESLGNTSQIFSALEEVPFVGVVLYTTKVIYANKSALQHLGYSLEELKQIDITDLVIQNQEEIYQIIQRRLKGEQFVRHHEPILLRKRDGSILYTYFFSKTVFVGGHPVGFSIVVDMTEKIQMEKELQKLYRYNEDLVHMLESLDGSILKLDKEFNIINASRYWQERFSRKGSNFLDHLEPKNRALLRYRVPPLFKDRLSSKDSNFEIKMLKLSEGYGVIIKDISHHEREKLQLRRKADYDLLTRLPNRTKCLQYIEFYLRSHRLVHDRITAICFLDLDNFKQINDTFGHSIGDKVLQTFAKRVGNRLKKGDKFCRFAGDEFVIIFPSIKEEQLPSIIQKIHDALQEPFKFRSIQIPLSTSIGVALIPKDGKNVDEILECADKAMYHAKKNGLPFALCNQEEKPLS